MQDDFRLVTYDKRLAVIKIVNAKSILLWIDIYGLLFSIFFVDYCDIL